MNFSILRLATLLVLCLALAACAGDDDDEVRGETNAPTTTEEVMPPPGEPDGAVEDFLEAVEANDHDLSWALLSFKTKTAFQIDKQHWVDTLLPALRKELDPGGKVVFDQRFGVDRALIVLQGVAKSAPFAAALRAEDGGWRLQLFYPEFTPMRPAPGERLRAGAQRIAFDIVRRRDQKLDVRMWLDGKPRAVSLETEGNFNNSYAATAPLRRGKHLLVVYATTGEGLSGGAAWEFSVG